jgi:ankyrin repeat protein
MPSATTRAEFQEIFSLYPGDSEWIEEQQYSTIHKILFGFIGRDLEEELKISTSTIDQPDAKGRTPLAWAAARADLHAIEVLLRYGADVNACCSTGKSPIIRAVRAPSPVGIVPLLNAGAKFDWKTKQKFTALTMGAYYQDGVDYLTPFLDRGANIEESDSYGMTPLACTTEYDHSKSAAVLLRYGANINTRCNDGWTPLLRAINSNSHRVLQLFLDNGADYLISSFKDETVLHFAARRGDLETMGLLGNADLKQLDIEAKTTKGHTAKELMEFRQDRSSELVTAFENLLKNLDKGKFEAK